MKNYIITEEVKNALIEYFSTKPIPYRESAPYIQVLSQLKETKEEKKK